MRIAWEYRYTFWGCAWSLSWTFWSAVSDWLNSVLCTAKLRYFFNLGGDYAVELVFLPGHTLGPEPGDPYGQYATVSGFRQQLARLVARVDEFDGIFPGHGLVDLGTMMLVNILEACDRVLADPQNHDNKAEMTFGGTTFICYNKMIYQSGYLSYSPSGI